MELRIFRTYKWQPVPKPIELVRFGSPPELMLVAHDELQYLANSQWVPVPIVEHPAPPKPVYKPS